MKYGSVVVVFLIHLIITVKLMFGEFHSEILIH